MKKAISIFSPKMFRHIFFSGILEFGPVLLFLASTEYVTIYDSTIILMTATIVSTFVTYRLQKRIPYLALYVAIITTVFGYMTLYFKDAGFLQMRDTLYDLTCALTLVTGMIFGISLLKTAFHQILPMTNKAWNKLTYLWVAYFLIVAFSNEIVRTFFTFSDWIIFKGVVVVFTCVYGFSALFFSYEPLEEKSSKEDRDRR